MSAIDQARQARERFRAGERRPTAGLAPAMTQANLIALPRDWAWDFLLYAQRNPQACPVLEVSDPGVHGAPIHVGDPGALGIRDIDRPDFGDPVRIEPGEIPVFWACGVTPQAAVMASKVPFALTHAPGHMFITDVPDSRYHV